MCGIALTAFNLSGCTDSSSSIGDPASSPVTSAQALLAPWDDDMAPGVAVAVSLDGEIVFSSGVGLANLEYNVPITPDSVFHSASVSKQFTAFSMLLLVSEGRASVDDDIRLYLPELQDRGRVVTIQHLLDHVSGYREISVLAGMAGWLEDDIRTNEQYMRLIAKQTGENFAPNARVEYSNTGYLLLSQIVEQISGESFDEYTKSRIFGPLEMNSTQFSIDRTKLIPDHAESYAPNNSDGFRKSLLVAENVGSTGLKTTALDLLKWAENFETQIVGNETLFALMAERMDAANGELSIFGRGQELRQYKGMQTWSHGGRDAGFRTFLMRIPEQEFAISILSNRADFDTAKIAFALTDIFLQDRDGFENTPQTSWDKETISELKALTGTYELYPGILFEISTTGENLEFSAMDSDERMILPQIGENQFILSPATDVSLIFDGARDGRSTGFNYTIGLHGSLYASRVDLHPFDPLTVDVKDYVGTYYSPELSTEYEVSIVDGNLTVSHLRMWSATMSAYQTDTFTAPEGFAQKFSFMRDENANVTSALISGAVAKDVIFYRVNREY